MERRTFLSLTASLPLLPPTSGKEAEANLGEDPPLFEPVKTVSTGAEINLKKRRVPEAPTVFVFYRPGSAMERDYLKSLQDSVAGLVGFRLIELKSGEEPVAQQYQITDTPTALVYDRRGRLVTRSNDATAIRAAVDKAAQVMRLDWAEEGTDLYEQACLAAGGKALKPGIMRTMSLKPEYLKPFFEMTRKAHFQDGFLPRRTKEMIATYVSGINHCKF
jgi:hypothetical protein